MSRPVLLHNPRCSKSREALALLQAHGVEPDIVRYLEIPLDATGLKKLVKQLRLPARALLRTGEDAYKTLGLADPEIGDDALIAAMAAHPILIERPVFIRNGHAVIGRPPERVLELLGD
jgi:arsenate reductase